MPVAFDNNASAIQSGSSPITWTHNCNGNFLVIGFVQQAGLGSNQIASVTCNGVAMNLSSAGFLKSSSGGFNCCQYWLANPGTGSLSIVATPSSNVLIGAISTSFTGAASSPVSVASATGVSPNNATVNVSSAVGSAIIDVMATETPASPSSLTNLIWHWTESTVNELSSFQLGTGSQITMGYSGMTTPWVITAMQIDPPGVTPPPTGGMGSGHNPYEVHPRLTVIPGVGIQVL